MAEHIVLVSLPGTSRKMIVDAADYDRLKEYRLSLYGDGYAAVSISGHSIRVHRFLLDAPDDKEVDHINHNRLDNRRANLRLCSRSENMFNRVKFKGKMTSRFKGVSYHRVVDKWAVNININGKLTHLGVFDSEETAARVYDRAAIEYAKEFACLNFPDFDYSTMPVPQPRRYTSRFHGVNKPSNRRKFRAQLWVDGKMKFVGCFTDEEDAARAYDCAARLVYGDQAKLNFPDE